MFWNLLFAVIVTLLRSVSAAESVAVHDAETGLTYSQNFALYKVDGRGITFRIAIPSNVSSNSAYDAVVQVIVPNDVGWAGLAWGGSMTKNPLMVFWRGSNNQPVLSSRWASHTLPQTYTTATYTLFKTGTKSNSTHWQFTALCTGCTSWAADGGAVRYIQPNGGNRLAFAYSPTKPSNLSSPTSAITVHDVHAYWNHDFGTARNAGFEAAVQRLLGSQGVRA
ncbi:CBD9-like protein [Neurospora hispaniola]|uniref:CBD9-like protein n=1 Tax=Neurospora hispaniola TaxID=588809 RepID=A0AAJ0I3I2_9PEZI|nr:CBD9-like protein [Neurospora hispaniola]